MSGDAFAEGGDSVPPDCHPASVAGGLDGFSRFAGLSALSGSGRALSIVAVRAAAKRLGNKLAWQSLRGRQNRFLRFVSQTPAETLDGAAFKLWLVVYAAETGAQSSRDLRMVRDALAAVERVRAARRQCPRPVA